MSTSRPSRRKDERRIITRDEARIDVVNALPVAVVDAPSLVDCTSFEGARVSLFGAASFDPDGLELAHHRWFVGGDLVAEGAEAEVTLPLGAHEVVLEVVDPFWTTARATTPVRVVDTTPPDLTEFAYDGPICLWPPNHSYVVLKVGRDFTAMVADVCDPAPALVIASAESSQPDEGGLLAEEAPSGRFLQISLGNGAGCGVRTDGSLVCFGPNAEPKMVLAPPFLPP